MLEDFLALVEHGSFTRAAESRFVSQPAFSRRIRSLEQWLGVELVDRNSYPAQLTGTGRKFASDISQLVRQTYDLRGRIRDHQADSQTLVLTTQHSLSVSFLPAWLASVAPLLGEGRIRLDAGNLHDSLDLFLSGRCDLLLCYDCAEIDPPLAYVDFESPPGRYRSDDSGVRPRQRWVSPLSLAGRSEHAVAALSVGLVSRADTRSGEGNEPKRLEVSMGV